MCDAANLRFPYHTRRSNAEMAARAAVGDPSRSQKNFKKIEPERKGRGAVKLSGRQSDVGSESEEEARLAEGVLHAPD